MTMTTSAGRVSTLRKMMCMLSCQPSAAPNGNPEYDLRQALECLSDTLSTNAVGIFWQQPGFTLHEIFPATFQLDPEFETKIVDITANPHVVEWKGEYRLFAAPMHVGGTTNGRLWALFPPARKLSAEEKDLLILAGNQLAMVLENFRLYEDTQRLAARRAELLRRVIAQQDERCRQISRELHDEISQSLTALAFDIEASNLMGVSQNINPLDKLPDFHRRVIAILKEVNRITLDLRPTLLEELGLLSALTQFANQRVPPATRVHINSNGQNIRLPKHIETTFYRIGQEAINNIVKHAQAKNIWLNLTHNNGRAELSVKDDGVGFEKREFSAPSDHRIGLGLFGMKERAALVGGTFSIESQPNHGTEIVIAAPVAEDVE